MDAQTDERPPCEWSGSHGAGSEGAPTGLGEEASASGLIGVVRWERSGKILEANDAFLDMVGFDRGALERGDVSWRMLTPPDLIHQDDHALAEIERGGVCEPFEKEYVRRDGRRVPVLVAGASKGGGGHAEQGIAVILDLSRRRQEDRLVRFADERVRGFLEHVPAFAWIKDEAGRFVWVNRLLMEFLARSNAEILGRVEREFWSEGSATRLAESDSRILEWNQPLSRIEVLVTASGERVQWQVVKFPVWGARGMRFIGGFALDVTEQVAARNDLAEWKSRYEAAVLATGQVLFDWDTSHDAVTVAGNHEAILGYTAKELAGGLSEWTERVHPDDRARFREELDRVVRTKDALLVRCRMRRKDGAWIVVQASGRFFATSGAGERMVGFMTDITDRTRADEELRASEARYRGLVEAQSEFVVRWRPDGTRTYVNEAYCRYFKTPREELEGTSFLPLVVECDRQDVLKKIASLTPEAPVGIDVHRVHLPDGSVGWHEWTDNAIFDAGGRIVELQSVGRNVTERVKAEAALRASEQRYRTLVDAAHDLILAVDRTGRILTVNPAFERMTGFRCEDWVGSALNELVAGADQERLAQIFARLKDGETVGAMEVGIGRLEGPPVQVECSFAAQVEGEEEISFLIIGRDVTDRQKLEEQLRQSQKMEAIGRLAGGIAHDFNNLLTVVNGCSEFALGNFAPTGAVGEALREIRKAGERAAQLTRQLLAFSRRSQAQPTRVCLNVVVVEMESLLRRLIGEDIELAVEPGSGTYPIQVDRAQLEQVILNLVVNARDAMPSGGRLTIETTACRIEEEDAARMPDRKAGDYVVLRVTDTGIGMDAATMTRLFEPFFTTKEAGRGTGLGLAMTYGIVRQSGGFIDVESEVGKGSGFSIFLPLSGSAVIEPVTTPRGTSVAAKLPGGRETILVVEDEQNVRALLRMILTSVGYQILEADGAESAQELALKHRDAVKLLLTDVVMPRLGGVELAGKLREAIPGLPVLFISGYSRLQDPAAGLGPGHAHLSKPFTATALTAQIRELLDGRV